MAILFSLVLGYLFGSIPFSHIVTRWRSGLDLRESTNRNVGASNAIRTIGFRWGLVAGVLDFAKGLAAIGAAVLLGVQWPLIFLAGLAAMIGHNYPVWLQFHGGKGVAVGIAVTLWAAPLAAFLGFFSGVVFYLWRRHILLTVIFAYAVVLGVLAASGAPAVLYWLIGGELLIMLIPNISLGIKMLRTPGGLRAYLADQSTSFPED